MTDPAPSYDQYPPSVWQVGADGETVRFLLPSAASGPSGPPEPPNRRRALTASAAVALLNLSGLGLGYVVLRRWRAAVLCWIATGILLLVALPADPNGVPGVALVAFVIVLVFAAVHGAVRAAWSPPRPPPRLPLAAALAVVLLAVPVGGVVLYGQARAEAVQHMLLGRLGKADAIVASTASDSFDAAQPSYDQALAMYRDLLDNHRGSRAGRQVPDRLAAFYQAVAARYTAGDYCGAIAPLTYLRTLPGTVGAADLGHLAAWPDDRLATSLYQCGMYGFNTHGSATAGTTDLNLLMSMFPTSSQAAQVAGIVAGDVAGDAGGLTGSDPCAATTALRTLDSQVAALASSDANIQAALAKAHGTADQDVESGSFDCGVAQYKKGDFTDTQTTMNTFATTYPHDPNDALAGKYVIAAQVAQNDPDAGRQTPTLASGGSVTITIVNDSPAAAHILYTGPATGTVDIAACHGCTVYSSKALGAQEACSNSGTDYPQATITMPPGTVYLLNTAAGNSVATPAATSQQTSDGDSYTECSYETSLLGSLLPPIPPVISG